MVKRGNQATLSLKIAFDGPSFLTPFWSDSLKYNARIWERRPGKSYRESKVHLCQANAKVKAQFGIQ